MIKRELKAIDYLEEGELEKIHQAALTVLEKNGVEFYSQEARDILKKGGRRKSIFPT